MEPLLIFFVIIIILLVSLVFSFVPIGLWISALAAGVEVGILTLIGMRLRRVPPHKIILPLIKAQKAGIDATIDKLEAHYFLGGNVDRVIDALIAAHRVKYYLKFESSRH